MGRMSKAKGARYERYIADIFTQAGYVAHRSAQYCGKTGDAPDVVGLPYIHIECKYYKDTAWLNSWMEQAKRDAKDGNIPVVIHKVNYGTDKATLDATDALEMLIEYMVAGNKDDLTCLIRKDRKYESMSGFKACEYLEKIDRGGMLVDMNLTDFIQLYREYEASRYLAEEAKHGRA